MIQHICKSQNLKLLMQCLHKMKWRCLSASGLKLLQVSVGLKLGSYTVVLILSSRAVVCLSGLQRVQNVSAPGNLLFSCQRLLKIGLNSRIASVLWWQRVHQARDASVQNCLCCFLGWSLTWRGTCSILYSMNYVSSSPFHPLVLQHFVYWWFMLMCGFRKRLSTYEVEFVL